MKRILMGASAFVVSLGVASAAMAADVALVISNHSYDGRSPIRDVRTGYRDLVRAYDRDGFDVISAQNASSTRMAELLREFEDAAADADRVVIHFNGYVEPSNQNLRMVPSDMTKGSMVGAHYAAPSLDLLYELVDHRPGRSAVFIATPQSNVGLAIAKGPHIPQGVLVMAGKPRTLNRGMAKALLVDNKPPTSLVNYADTFITGYISDQPLTPAAVVVEDRAPTAADNTAQEMRAWRTAAQNGSREALEGYLRAYPNGLFRREAQARIDALAPAVSPEERLEQALNLTRAQRRNIQKNLTLLGFNTRGVDGIFGNGSRRAISNWQRSEGFRQTGFLDRAQIRVLEEAARVRQQELDAKAEADRAARDQQDLAFWQSTGSSGEEADLRAYLDKYPDGLFAPQAKRLLADIEASKPKVDTAALARENALNLNGQTRLLVEQRLAGLRLNPGRVDGNFDENTRTAIAAFQKSRNLRETGYLDSDTVGQLIVSVFGR